jgi:signal transduction histidine kinase
MHSTPAPFPSRHRWAAAVLLGVAGLLLNLRPLPLSPGTDLVFGGVAYLLAAVALGPGQGALAAAIASVRTVFLWGHPYAWINFVLEALVVGWLVRRRDRRPLVADLVYWAVLGVPILFLTYWGILGVRGSSAAVLFLKQPFNGLICALTVEALLLVPSVRRMLGVHGRPPVRAALAVVVALAATVPALAFGLWTGRREWERGVEQTRERLHLFAQAHAARLEQYVRLHEQEVRAVAEAAERRGDMDAASLQRHVTSAHEQFPGFVNVYAANGAGRTIAFHPERSGAGRSLIGLDFSDRDYYRRLRETRRTVISDVFPGDVTEKPLIVIAHPIILGDTLAGFVLGALDLDAIPPPQPEPGDARMRVADAGGRLVYDSRRRYRPGDPPVVLADSAAFLAVASSGGRPTVAFQPSSGRTATGTEGARVLAGTARIPSLGWWVWAEQPYTAIQGFVAESYVRLLSLLIGVALLALAVSNVLSTVLARPLLRMRAAATALAAGQRGARVGPLPAASPAEVAQLGRDFDDMAEALAGRTEELEELGEIARSLASTLETDEVLRRVTDAAARLVDADGCAIALMAPGGQTLRLADHSLGLMAPVAGLELPADASLLGWVARNGECVLVTDVMADPRVAQVSGGLTEAGSVICAPLLGRSGALGTLLAASVRGADPFTEADLRLLDRLSRQAAVAVENAHLVEAERRRARESESIRLVARTVSTAHGLQDTLQIVAREACGIVGADACRVLLLRGDEEGVEVVATSGVTPDPVGAVLPVRGELLEAPLRRGRAAIVDRDESHAAAVPLRVGDETLGVLAATRNDAPFGPEDARLLAAFADHAAVALRNARLLEAAQAAARTRAEFIATMSHELRTPLNAVLGHLQILEMQIHGPLTPEQRESLGRIEAASRHLRGLIEEVLSFSRLEAGRVETRLQAVDVCELGGEVAAVIEPLATEKKLAFRLETCDPPPVVRTDPDKVRQILINLAGNAVKFTDQGEVRIGVARRGEGVALSVADTGPGIAPEDRERVFRPFEQLHTGFARPHGGTGLGLYLSGQYARMLGGTIEIDSELGRGSTFSLLLPTDPPAEVEAADADAQTAGGMMVDSTRDAAD